MANAVASSGLPTKGPSLPAIKRRANGTTTTPTTVRNSKRISSPTMRKIFAAMLAAIALLYFVLVFFFFRRSDLKSYKNGSDWGPSLRQEAGVWQHHLDNLAQQKAAKIEEIINMSPPKRNSPISGMRDLEDTDIHEMISPEEIKRKKDHVTYAQAQDTQNNQQRVLTAYLEPINLPDFEMDPLPIRKAVSGNLKAIKYPAIIPCKSLNESWGANDIQDPFLPIMQRAFPTDDGRHIQIEAQAPLPCRNDASQDDTIISKKLHLQAALFQPVSVKRIEKNNHIRYQLSNDNENEGSMTRFICRFEPSGHETLSIFIAPNGAPNNSNVEKVSNLRFQCPVPESLVDTVRDGTSVTLGRPSLFLTLVPIRTPPRKDATTEALPPCYLRPENAPFQYALSVGADHFLPELKDSGRWENIPVCVPPKLAKTTAVGS